jgi:hypothetical protein
MVALMRSIRVNEDTVDEGADDKMWHPHWLGHVGDDVNAEFIEEIINRVHNTRSLQS